VNIIGIGSAQFGEVYGINHEKKIPLSDIKKIIEYANNRKGFGYLDTAAAYENSEKILGNILKKKHFFKIITKTELLNEDEVNFKVIDKFKKNFFLSLQKLKQKKIYSVLIHNSADLFKKNSELLYNELKNFKKKNLIQKIGVSVYNKKEIDMILSYYDFDIFQLPCNILDQRLIHNNTLEKLFSKKIEMHARSVFLQGLLLMKEKKLPPYFIEITKKLKKLNDKLIKYKITPVQAALSFVANLNKFKSLIVGFNNFTQFKEVANCKLLKLPFKTNDLFCNDEKFVDPRFWKNL
jgi:aryl-alcohol dehydrogenase-like predicted oxidoreductase